MARAANTNYQTVTEDFEIADAGADAIERADLQKLAKAVDNHDHNLFRGLGVRRLQTASAPVSAGQVQVTGDSLKWWGGSALAVRTAVTVEGTETISGQKVFSTNLGLGVTPSAWGATRRAIQVSAGGSVSGSSAGTDVALQANTYNDGTNNRAIVTGAAASVSASGDAISFQTAPSVSAGSVQTFTERFRVDANGAAFSNHTITTSAVAGGASALPATPSGYLHIVANGTSAKIPFYNV